MDFSFTFPDQIGNIMAMASSVLNSGIGHIGELVIGVPLAFMVMKWLLDLIWGPRIEENEIIEDEDALMGLGISHSTAHRQADEVHGLGRSAERAVRLRRNFEAVEAGGDHISVND